MAARRSTGTWEGAAGAAAQAEGLRRRVAPLADLDAKAYADALATMRSPEGSGPDQRDAAIVDSLLRAAEVPLLIAEAAADTAALASTIAEVGDQAVRADAAAAAALAAGAGRAAANLVAINLVSTENDERVRRALTYADDAAASARRVLDLPA